LETPDSGVINLFQYKDIKPNSKIAKTILRIKAKVVRVSPDLKLDSDNTVLEIYDPGNPSETYVIQGPENTRMIDSLLQAQMEYQSQKKTDLTWIKGR
jgi:hypothetical protein